MWRTALDCYDFDAGQPRHFPAGSYYAQVATATGELELELMRLLWRCWLVFKHKKTSDWNSEDTEFGHWLAVDPPDDTALNQVILWQWQVSLIT